MSLDLTFSEMQMTEVGDFNITHNLTDMADAAGIYGILWRPDENGITQACDMIAPLAEGISAMKQEPDKFMALSATNRWGTYEQFLDWLEQVLQCCVEHPQALVRADR